ncbi:MAG: riboflavin synthase [Saprospiraceae bacterium]
MFTGIIETLGKIEKIEAEGSNLHFTVATSLSQQLQVDQSVAHNGVCLTVVEVNGEHYKVTAIEETLQRSNIGNLRVGDYVNLERAMQMGARLDGHMVQGHVDGMGTCLEVTDLNGSWLYRFEYVPGPEHILVDKGSICVNGTSLTVINPHDNIFEVAIIPYTFEHTVFQYLKAGDKVNLEFDIIGKYIAKYAALYK